MRKTVDYNCAFLKLVEDRYVYILFLMMNLGRGQHMTTSCSTCTSATQKPVTKISLTIAEFGSAETGGTGELCNQTF